MIIYSEATRSNPVSWQRNWWFDSKSILLEDHFTTKKTLKKYIAWLSQSCYHNPGWNNVKGHRSKLSWRQQIWLEVTIGLVVHSKCSFNLIGLKYIHRQSNQPSKENMVQHASYKAIFLTKKLIQKFQTYMTNSQCDQLPDGLITQLVEHCTGIKEVMGSNPIQVMINLKFISFCTVQIYDHALLRLLGV